MRNRAASSIPIVIFILPMVGSLLAADPAKPATDRERLVGTWAVVEYEIDGKIHNDSKTIYRFSTNDVKSWQHGSGADKVRFYSGFEVDEKANPKHLDLIESDGMGIETRYTGIYEWDGEKLIWTYAHTADGVFVDPKTNINYTARPSELMTKPGDKMMRTVLTRVTGPKLATPPDEIKSSGK
jgi:uncharacterized protein (TIGR03067 family)